jgi:hypothetical protein
MKIIHAVANPFGPVAIGDDEQISVEGSEQIEAVVKELTAKDRDVVFRIVYGTNAERTQFYQLFKASADGDEKILKRLRDKSGHAVMLG